MWQMSFPNKKRLAKYVTSEKMKQLLAKYVTTKTKNQGKRNIKKVKRKYLEN